MAEKPDYPGICPGSSLKAFVNGGNVFYESRGSGPTLVLVHGFPLDHTMWTPQIDHVSKAFRVIAPDLRGHGQSQVTGGVYTMELLARDVNALLDHVGLGHVVVGGLSMGGYVVLSFLRQFGDRVHGLILADTRAEADTPEARVRREAQAQNALQNGSKNIVGEMLGKMFTEETMRAEPGVVEGVRRVMESMSPVAVAAALRGMAQRQDSTGMLGLVHVPTLVLVGERDEITPVGYSRRMAELIPGAELVVIPNAAHLTTLEKPELVNEAIWRFLQRIPR